MITNDLNYAAMEHLAEHRDSQCFEEWLEDFGLEVWGTLYEKAEFWLKWTNAGMLYCQQYRENNRQDYIADMKEVERE